jgi:transposase
MSRSFQLSIVWVNKGQEYLNNYKEGEKREKMRVLISLKRKAQMEGSSK